MVKCAHGVKTNLVPRPDIGEGWVEPFAECRLCNGRPAGIPYLEHTDDQEQDQRQAQPPRS